MVIHDISTTGMLLESKVALRKDACLAIDLPEVGATQALVVWSSGAFFGCQFVQPIGKGAISAARLRNPVVPLPAPFLAPKTEADPEAEADQLSFGTKLRIILLSSLGLWALIVAGIAKLWPG